jgi:predicted nucleotide-binding protein (sugar kinase/HSP70/actin superfamily)
MADHHYADEDERLVDEEFLRELRRMDAEEEAEEEAYRREWRRIEEDEIRREMDRQREYLELLGAVGPSYRSRKPREIWFA